MEPIFIFQFFCFVLNLSHFFHTSLKSQKNICGKDIFICCKYGCLCFLRLLCKFLYNDLAITTELLSICSMSSFIIMWLHCLSNHWVYFQKNIYIKKKMNVPNPNCAVPNTASIDGLICRILAVFLCADNIKPTILCQNVSFFAQM